MTPSQPSTQSLRELAEKWRRRDNDVIHSRELEALLPSLESALGERQGQPSVVSNWGFSGYIPVLPPEQVSGSPGGCVPAAPIERLRGLADEWRTYAKDMDDYRAAVRYRNCAAQLDSALAAHEAQQAERIADEHGWLIERNESGFAEWAIAQTKPYRAFKWTRKSEEALRFARKQDAEATIVFMQEPTTKYFASEHIWAGQGTSRVIRPLQIRGRA